MGVGNRIGEGEQKKKLCVILFFKSIVNEIIEIEDVTHVLNVLQKFYLKQSHLYLNPSGIRIHFCYL